MSAVADKLREARALIERGWTQHVFARDHNGWGVSIMSASATCFCAMGALERVAGGTYAAAPLMERVQSALGVGDAIAVATFNDARERTQAEVLAVFDKAIALAQGIEAGTATTPKSGVVHESPVGSADAPGTSQ